VILFRGMIIVGVLVVICSISLCLFVAMVTAV
jgi:hypothetical protein